MAMHDESELRDGLGRRGSAPPSDRVFIAFDTARTDGLGITVCYWETEESIVAWKAQADHLEAQREGRARWYDAYELRVARVERAYGFARSEQ